LKQEELQLLLYLYLGQACVEYVEYIKITCFVIKLHQLHHTPFGSRFRRVVKVQLHVHSVNFAAKLVLTRHALSSTVINSHQEPVSGQACNPPDPHSFFLSFFAVEELYGTRYQSGSFSLINVGSGFHCLRSFSFSSSFSTAPPSCENFASNAPHTF
jgi:hypothetical protein